jgi:rRNA maturation protein Nop10
MKKMRFCQNCKKYTLENVHCGLLALSAHPAPFKPDDRFASYRRMHNVAV